MPYATVRVFKGPYDKRETYIPLLLHGHDGFSEGRIKEQVAPSGPVPGRLSVLGMFFTALYMARQKKKSME